MSRRCVGRWFRGGAGSGLVSGLQNHVLARLEGGGYAYFLDKRPERLCQWQSRALERNTSRRETPVQRTHVVRLRRRDTGLDLRDPGTVRGLGL